MSSSPWRLAGPPGAPAETQHRVPQGTAVLVTGVRAAQPLPAVRFLEKEDQPPPHSNHGEGVGPLGDLPACREQTGSAPQGQDHRTGQPCCGQDTPIKLRMPQERAAERRAPGQAHQAPRQQVGSPVGTVL